MFWNKKKPKSKPQIKTTVPKTFKAKEPPPRWQPTFGETKKKDEKPPEVTTKSEPKIDWEDKFLKSFQKLTYRHRAWDVWRDYILLHACSISNVLDKDNYDQREKRYLKIIHRYSKRRAGYISRISSIYNHGPGSESRAGFSRKNVYAVGSWKSFGRSILHTVSCLRTYGRSGSD